MSLLSSALDLAMTLAARALKLKRVDLPPSLDGPVHVYPPTIDSASYYELHICTKCGLYNGRRAAYTQPPCSERLPSIVVELP